jgi:hypothetical protein
MTVAPRCTASWDEQPPRHAASAVHQYGLPGTNLERVADHLVGGQRRDRQRRGGLERYARRQDGHMLDGGDVLLGPGALLAQRSRVHGHPVACRDPRHLVSDGGGEPGRLHA